MQYLLGSVSVVLKEVAAERKLPLTGTRKSASCCAVQTGGRDSVGWQKKSGGWRWS